MYPKVRIRELREIDLEGGYLIDGFPSVGFSSAIATESLVHTSNFGLAGIVDSEAFPPISIVSDSKPNYPTRIFVNDSLKVGAFLSYLTLEQQMHRTVAKAMLEWAKGHKVGLIVSSVAVRAPGGGNKVLGIGSTERARARIEGTGLGVLESGTVPGMPGMLLNGGSVSGQDVIVLVFHTDADGPDYRSSAELCMAISKLIPGASCNIQSLQKEAERAQAVIKEAEAESRHLKDSMYG